MPIAVVRGAPTPQIQALFASFVARLGTSARVVGVVEEEPVPGRDQLRSLADGRRFEVFQALGRGSSACSVDAGSIVSACEAVLGDIAAGCDLVVLSKFGKLESIGQGLGGAFKAALAAGVPVLTTVSASLMPKWTAFASPLFVSLPAEPEQIDTWLRAVAADASVQ